MAEKAPSGVKIMWRDKINKPVALSYPKGMNGWGWKWAICLGKCQKSLRCHHVRDTRINPSRNRESDGIQRWETSWNPGAWWERGWSEEDRRTTSPWATVNWHWGASKCSTYFRIEPSRGGGKIIEFPRNPLLKFAFRLSTSPLLRGIWVCFWHTNSSIIYLWDIIFN